MTTETVFNYDDSLNDFINQMSLFYSNDLEQMQSYVEFTRHSLEITELHCMQMCAFELLIENFTIYKNDCFKRKNWTIQATDETLINTLTNNFLSCSNNLVENIENFIKNNVNFETFKSDYINSAYDSNMYYRFFYQLRNYTQHGHNAVKINKEGNHDRFYFCFHSILSTPHFSLKSEVKNEMETMITEVGERYNDVMRLAYLNPIVEYHKLILNIYFSFISLYPKELKKRNKKIQHLWHKYSNNVTPLGLMYQIENEVHVFNIEPVDFYHKKLEDLKKYLENLDNTFKDKMP